MIGRPERTLGHPPPVRTLYPRRVRRLLLALALLSSPAVSSAQPRAAPSNPGERRYREGYDAFARRDYAAAAVAFRLAYELTHDPALLFNLGSALESDGQRDAARESFEAYLRATPDTPNRAVVEARLRSLQPAVVAPAPPSPVAAAIVRVAPPGAVAPRPGSPWPVAGAVVGGVGVIAAALGLGLYLDVDARFDRCAQVPCPREDQPRGEDVASVALLWGGGALAVAGLVTFLLAPRPARSASARVFISPTLHGLTIGGAF